MGKKEKKVSEEIGKQLETMNVKIKEIPENPEKKISPVIGYFPSGFDPLKNSEESNSQSRVSSVKVYKNAKRNPKNPRLEVVVGVGGSAVNFVGTSYSGEARTPQICNYALGVLDKNTGVLKMVPIAANKIFRLEPKVHGVEQPENESRDAEKEADTYEERSEKFMNATRMYSTKKNIRRDEKRVTLRRTEDVGAQEGMEQKLEGIKVNMEALVEAVPSTANARNIPPHNLDANEVEMAYPLDKIILKGEWDYLQDIFDKLHGGSELAQDVYPSFVLNRAQSLQKIKNESSRRRMAGILSYITHLIRFKDRHSMDGVSSAKFHRLPSILSQKFSTMFASTTDKRLPQDKQDLLISYVLVLSLFADDFRSDPSDIARDLRMNPLTLRTHYESLGCKFVRENMSLVATLPLPLTFQTIKIKRKRQK
ncbi:DNA-directed RNA polymerase I subunit rpa49-like [Salvia hispanica]|uniref:DNA-directed RNA polymerase I subunit rpa49-like n=1 Tax=Salvia hispanica TaxID=49212 RepID=UPI0020092BE0|nr:DNA-directed RNA polymerase I subunit rpa49-like [Salvia hispanica]